MNAKNEEFSPLTPHSLDAECHRIATWWIEKSQDGEFGGFFGEIDFAGEVVPNANKGIILNARILWFFSQAAREYSSSEYRQIADKAYHYLIEYFDDPEHGGVVWELDHRGHCIKGKKQTYAQSFAIYGLSAYYLLTKRQAALDKALEYFRLIENRAIDAQFGGYLEAFSQSWGELNDVRLSEKDRNSPKSMNTHIHVLEAYTCLYRASLSPAVGDALKQLISTVCNKILNKETHHLYLFQAIDWSDQSDCFSYGHDIECSWLIWDALTALGDAKLQAEYRSTVLKMAEVCLVQSIGDLGQVCDQFSFVDKKKHRDSFWWVQAEALVGFLNAYQLSGNPAYIKACESIWRFTQEQHIDLEKGEWHWIAKREQDPTNAIYKAGFWKAPYHNGRAMMEAAELIRQISTETTESNHVANI
jgi:mannobiose 2-epimerase